METPLRWTHIYVPISEPRLGDTFPLLVLKPQIRGSLTDEHQACTTTRKQHRNPNNLNFALHCQCLWGINIGLVNLGFYGHARVIFLPQGTALSCLWLPEATGPPHQLNSSSYTVSKQFYTPSIKSKAILQVFQALEHMMELRLCDQSQLMPKRKLWASSGRSVKAEGKIQSHQAAAITCLCGWENKEKNALPVGTSVLTIGTTTGCIW